MMRPAGFGMGLCVVFNYRNVTHSNINLIQSCNQLHCLHFTNLNTTRKKPQHQLLTNALTTIFLASITWRWQLFADTFSMILACIMFCDLYAEMVNGRQFLIFYSSIVQIVINASGYKILHFGPIHRNTNISTSKKKKKRITPFICWVGGGEPAQTSWIDWLASWHCSVSIFKHHV